MLSKADYVIIKLSPMLDWHRAVSELNCVREVHIISVNNECKELLLVLSARNMGGKVNLDGVVFISRRFWQIEDMPGISAFIASTIPNPSSAMSWKWRTLRSEIAPASS